MLGNRAEPGDAVDRHRTPATSVAGVELVGRSAMVILPGQETMQMARPLKTTSVPYPQVRRETSSTAL